MSPATKALVIELLEVKLLGAASDQSRMEMVTSHLSSNQMDSEFGESGRTYRQIMTACNNRVAKFQAALAEVKAMP